MDDHTKQCLSKACTLSHANKPSRKCAIEDLHARHMWLAFFIRWLSALEEHVALLTRSQIRTDRAGVQVTLFFTYNQASVLVFPGKVQNITSIRPQALPNPFQFIRSW